jgi:CRP/FNR family transcriptional regulator, cyclic AMP receptor protein
VRVPDHPSALLAQIPLFSALDQAQLARVASLARTADVPKGELLTREGEPGDDFFVIEKGKARVTLEGKKLAVLGPGEFFGEMALLDQGPRSATVTASSAMRLYVFGAEGFGQLLDGAPDVGKKILRGVAERLRAAQVAEPAGT